MACARRLYIMSDAGKPIWTSTVRVHLSSSVCCRGSGPCEGEMLLARGA